MIGVIILSLIVFPVIGGMIATRKEKPEDQRYFQRISELNQ